MTEEVIGRNGGVQCCVLACLITIFSGGVTARAKGRYVDWEMSGVGAHDVKVPKNQ